MPSTSSRLRSTEEEEIAEQDAPFIRSLIVNRAKAPMTDRDGSLENTDCNIQFPTSSASIMPA